ncbi:MAG: tRNA lysidine(34) synthetase TilS [Oscillospiraceae bacterium]|jgi:tRNA(Ile)-lysidine synthase|nr:tRNA lysidine(34) synthetase TilS [Oscillospiraceae bacterium]
MLRKIERYADKYEMLPESGGSAALGLSGGADSMCLLDVLLRLGRERGFTVTALHYNHKLRGEASDSDERFAAGYCAERGIELISGSAPPLERVTEDALRTLRYEFFAASGFSRIALAHHADDNAENYLMRLKGIPPTRGSFVRPLLCVTRAEIVRYNEKYFVPNIEDESNADTVYTRNRVRSEIMPLIREINPQFAKAVHGKTERERSDESFLRSLAEAYLAENSRKALAGLHAALLSRVLLMKGEALGIALRREQIDGAAELIKNGAAVWELSLTGKICIKCKFDSLTWVRT